MKYNIEYGYLAGFNKQHIIKLRIQTSSRSRFKSISYTVCGRKLMNPIIYPCLTILVDICHACRNILWDNIITKQEWTEKPKADLQTYHIPWRRNFKASEIDQLILDIHNLNRDLRYADG